MFIWLMIACAELDDPTLRHAPSGDGVSMTTAAASSTSSSTLSTAPSSPAAVETGDTGMPLASGPCPVGMVHLDTFCIDAWEAHLLDASPFDVPTTGVAATAPGVVPQGYISGDVAEAACEAAGKRLCTSDEWLAACQGAASRTYPYGEDYDPSVCNDTRSQHPIVELFGDEASWLPDQMNDPRLNQLPDSLQPAGSYPDCVTPEGVYDLHGNLHEWVADAEGVFRGGFYVDAVINGAGCSYRTSAHGRGYHDYSTGFRCCAAPAR